ncbi:hypothetical protein G7062_02270 [Erysipelothrix sp. HDW6C]|uniref:hypothetical protein n=1 Tax=Erysipelothrix sp. HDW6C TaxID=2714930 RepID=UPI00140E1696|nr:hypothetical protein [Erysipelothrix sp. HDW6C]QIK69182.1 hypothetical protein G7062_02270 [Erysipelothrix sp. HDW6C]
MKLKLLLTLMFGILLFVPATYAEETPPPVDEEITEKSSSTGKRAGSYYVEFYSTDFNGKKIIKSVRLMIELPNTIVNKSYGEGIDAADLRLSIGATEQLTHQQLVEFSGAHAWDIESGQEIPIDRVVVTKQTDNHYKVDYFTKKGTSTRTTILESAKVDFAWDDMVVNPNTYYLINNGLISLTVFAVVLVPLVIALIVFIQLGRRIKEAEEVLYQIK